MQILVLRLNRLKATRVAERAAEEVGQEFSRLDAFKPAEPEIPEAPFDLDQVAHHVKDANTLKLGDINLLEGYMVGAGVRFWTAR